MYTEHFTAVYHQFYYIFPVVLCKYTKPIEGTFSIYEFIFIPQLALYISDVFLQVIDLEHIIMFLCINPMP